METGTLTKSAVIKGANKSPKRCHLYEGRLCQDITTSKRAEYCAGTNLELLHICQTMKSKLIEVFLMCSSFQRTEN